MNHQHPYYQDESVTLWHGDCLSVTDWLSADVLVTDPPYGIGFVSSRTTRTRSLAGDSDTATRDATLALWGNGRPACVFGQWKAPRPNAVRHLLIWDKTDGTGPGMGDLQAAFGTSHEEIYLLGAWPKRGNRRGSVLRTSVAMGNPNGLVATSGHPTPKPVALMAVLLDAAPPGVVADPFAGTGATLLAAKLTGRRAIGVEVEECYCEAAAKRLAQGSLLEVAAP
jgi:site-specific DNA-methyltransferase (adenine-specific)